MPRVGSGDGWDVGLHEQGDNPGAGSTDFTIFTDTGLNGTFKRLWRGVKSILNPDGTMQDDKVDGRNLKSTVADGATLEASASTGVKVIRIKDLGVSTVKIAALAVSTAKLAELAVDAAKLKSDATVDANRAVTTNHVRDAAITAPKLATNSVLYDKPPVDSRSAGFSVLFDSRQVAGTNVGDAAPAITEWVETPTTYVTKIRGMILIKASRFAANKTVKMRLRANAKSATASGWKVQLTAATLTTSTSGTNTSYELVNREVILSIDIMSSGTVGSDSQFEYSVELACLAAGGGNVASLKNVVITIDAE